jgi:hypothetical protein
MLLTFNDWIVLFALLSVCAFITYTVNEVGNAIYDWLNDY